MNSADKKSAPARARSSEVQANGNALQGEHSIAPPQEPLPPTQSSYGNIPAELRVLQQWVAADADKRPINPNTGYAASPTDPATWGTFAQACAYADAHDMRIGFVFTSGDPYCGIDLDRKAGDEAEAKLHGKIIEAFPSYTERSASGAGYHIIVQARLGAGRRRDSVEVYSEGRYFIFTGNVVRQVPIADCQAAVESLVSEMPVLDSAELVEVEPTRSDKEIDEQARAARNGEKFARLWAGDWHAMGYPSQSEADMALMEFLCLYSISNEQCRRMFRASGLYRPKKATRAYLDRMLAKLRAQQDTSDVRANVATWFPQVGPGEGAGDDDLLPIPGPEVTDGMYYGLVGEVMRAASNGTEVHPAAAGLAFLTAASAALGRQRFVPIGDTLHHARLYSIHVGRSSRAGKGMALALVKRIREKIACGNFHDGGLSSREGLTYQIRDASDEKNEQQEPLDPGVDDKRLLVVEEELANVLKQAARDGNTLSSAIRTAWDGNDLAPATKTSRIRASKPHIAIHAGITPFELRLSLDQNSLSNGFANRFLFCWAERRGIVPYPHRTPDEVVEWLAQKLLTAILRAQQPGEVRATDAAKERYTAFYREHRRGLGRTEQLRGLLERHPPYAWRLALTFALLDCKDEIDDGHMAAAIAWLDYFRESTRFIFSDARQEAEASKAAGLGARIVAALQEARDQTMDREALRVAVKKPSAKELNAALQDLQDAGMVEEAVTQRPNGWPLRLYRLKGVAPLPPTRRHREGTP